MSYNMIKKLFDSIVIALILTAGCYLVGMKAGWITELNWLEIFSVFTSFSGTWLCVVQTRSNYPINAISVVALSVLFWQQHLYSSMALNIYLFPVFLYGWWRWREDSNTRPVTTVSLVWWPVYLGLTVVIWGTLVFITSQYGAAMSATDSFILAGSILAQFLLDQKKIENWAVWAIINVVAIYTYWQGGLPLVAMQYVIFLGNTALGFYMWYSTPAIDEEGLKWL